jgi:hypothetical protein
MMGGVVKQDALKYFVRLFSIAPEVTRFEGLHPGASWARSVVIPKTLVALLYAIVRAVPDYRVIRPDADQPPKRAFAICSDGEGKEYTASTMKRCSIKADSAPTLLRYVLISFGQRVKRRSFCVF